MRSKTVFSIVGTVFIGTAHKIWQTLVLLTTVHTLEGDLKSLWWERMSTFIWIDWVGLICIITFLFWLIKPWKCNSRDAPKVERISLVDFLKLAEKKGWKLREGDSVELLDLGLGLHQALVDGTFKAWGRQNQSYLEDTQKEPLIEIDKGFWVNHKCNMHETYKVEGKIDKKAGKVNYIIDWRKNISAFTGEFRDIHFEKGTAIKWLKAESESYKGKHDSMS